MSKTATPASRSAFRLVLWCAALGFGIKAFLLSPLYVRLATDALYSNAWWIEILYQLTDGGLIDLAVFAVCYPTTVYIVRREGFKCNLRLYITFSLLTFFKFAANFVVNAITDRAFPDMEEFLMADLPMIILMFALELLQYALIVLIAVFVRWLYDARTHKAAHIASLPRNRRVNYPAPPTDFPFVKIYARRNALQRGALLSALVITLGRVGMHFVYQIALFTTFGESDGWTVMLIDLVSDIFVGVIFYFVSLLLMMHFYIVEQKKG